MLGGTLTLCACPTTDSLGDYESSSSDSGESTSTTDGVTPDPGTSGTSVGGETGDTGMVDTGMVDTGMADTGMVGECEFSGCAVDCESYNCGALGEFDADGCLRQPCGGANPCGEGEVCYQPELFGGCTGSANFCEYDEELMACSCGGTDDCGGSFCVAEAEYPEPMAGPRGGARIENGCSPDDGPAKNFLFGLPDDTCESPLIKGTSVSITLYDTDAPVTGTFPIGIQNSSLEGQGVYTDDEGETYPIWLGTLTIDSWDASGATGSYEIWAGETAEGGFNYLADTFTTIQDCGGDPFCG